MKKALDKAYETMQYEVELLESFAAGKRPPQKFSDAERDRLLKAAVAQEVLKHMRLGRRRTKRQADAQRT